jgi:hypothetical protein
MTDIEDENSDEREDDVSFGRNADSSLSVKSVFPPDLMKKFEIFSYRNATHILASGFPKQFGNLLDGLRSFKISPSMIRMPGGSKGPIAKYADTVFTEEAGWVEARLTADLEVKLYHAKKKNLLLHSYQRKGFLDGHRIDFLNGRLALDFEWNSKDQTYDRDLYAFSAFYEAGAIDVGVIVTRGSTIDTQYLRGLGKVLKKDGTEGGEDVYKKFGASTTWMGKLLYRLDAGRNGGCPVVAIGITPHCVAE